MLENIGPALAGLYPFFILGVIALDWILPRPRRFQPLWILRQSATQLAKKVHPSVARPRMQQRISGLMAAALLWVLIVGSGSAFYALVELKQLFALALLFLLLGQQPWRHEAKLILRALERDLKSLARSRLGSYLHRDCSTLTAFSMQKATLEHTIHQLQGWCGTLFWFVLLGPIGALNYRVLFELNKAWPQRLPGWQDFGYASATLFRIFNWLPERILLSLVWLYLRITRRQPTVEIASQQAWYAYLSQVTDAPLGGPVKYRGITVSRPRWGVQKTREISEIRFILRNLKLIQGFWLLLLFPLWLIINIQV